MDDMEICDWSKFFTLYSWFGWISLSLSLSLSLIQALLIVFFDYGWVLVDLVGFGYGTCLWCFIFYFILMRAIVVVW